MVFGAVAVADSSSSSTSRRQTEGDSEMIFLSIPWRIGENVVHSFKLQAISLVVSCLAEEVTLTLTGWETKINFPKWPELIDGPFLTV